MFTEYYHIIGPSVGRDIHATHPKPSSPGWPPLLRSLGSGVRVTWHPPVSRGRRLVVLFGGDVGESNILEI